MKLRILERAKIGLIVIAIAMAWSGLWYLTMPIYSRFWQFKTLPVYGFVIFLTFGFISLLLYLPGSKTANRIYHVLYWLPISLGMLIAVVWGVAAVP
jgi:hypothetical protein